MAPSILLSALALAAYWDYEVCVGTSAVQYHAAAGRRHPSHRLGSFAGLQGSVLVYDGGAEGRSAAVSLVCAPRAGIIQVHEPEPYHYRLLLGTPAACRREAGLAALRAWVARQRGTCFTTAGRAWSGGDPPPYAREAGRRVLPEETEADVAPPLSEWSDVVAQVAEPLSMRFVPLDPTPVDERPGRESTPIEPEVAADGRILRRQPPPPQRPLSPNTPPTSTPTPPAATATGRRQMVWDKPVRGLGELPVGFRPPAPPEPPRPASAGRRAAAPPPAVPRPAAEPEWRSRLAIAIVLAAFAVLITILARLDDSDDDGAAADGEQGPWGRVAARVRAAQAIAEQRADLAAARAARRRPPAYPVGGTDGGGGGGDGGGGGAGAGDGGGGDGGAASGRGPPAILAWEDGGGEVDADEVPSPLTQFARRRTGERRRPSSAPTSPHTPEGGQAEAMRAARQAALARMLAQPGAEEAAHAAARAILAGRVRRVSGDGEKQGAAAA